MVASNFLKSFCCGVKIASSWGKTRLRGSAIKFQDGDVGVGWRGGVGSLGQTATKAYKRTKSLNGRCMDIHS